MAKHDFTKLFLPTDMVVESATKDDVSGEIVLTTSEGTVKYSINDLIDTSHTMRYNSSVTRTSRGVYFDQAETGERKPKVEKRYVMPSDGFSLVDFTDLGVIDEDKSMMPKFVIG